MEEDLFNLSLQDVKCEIRCAIIECQKRCLMRSSKWLSEMCHGLADVQCQPTGKSSNSGNSCFSNRCAGATGTPNVDQMRKEGRTSTMTGLYQTPQPQQTKPQTEASDGNTSCQYLVGIDPSEMDNYFLAKSYFDMREYDRAAYFVRNCQSSVPRFLHLYATYMAREKRRLDSTTDQSNLNDSVHVRDLAELLSTLRAEDSRGNLDGYGMYLYGVVLKALNLNQKAVEVLMVAIRMTPMLWAAYVELAPLITEKEKLLSLQFRGHWMRHFFIAHTYIEMYLNDEGLKAYEELQTAGFRKCVYVTSQMALAYHNKRDVDKAIEIFQVLQEADPYRLDNMDTYSNLLFVKELKTEMAQLAHKAVGINKYCPETCCVIGNYYSIRCDHQMAILYFQRALKLNPKYLSAWTLMGHEFMELKNTNAAIQSYRKAVEVNKRDYRAWYGLGQSYEILKMHYYSLYYFKIAHQLRPYDSRMLVALGETYEKLDKTDNAIKCYWKACDVGDIEGVAMYKLANLHEKLGEYENAVQCYVMYCEDERAAADKQSLYHGYMTLANYYESKAQYDRASHYAYKCLESDDRKSEAKSLLKTIENKRSGKASDTLTATANASNVNANAHANADTSSDDDMEMDLSDFKFVNTDYMLSWRNENKSAGAAIGNASAIAATTTSARVGAAEVSAGHQLHRTSSGDNNLEESDMKMSSSSITIENNNSLAANISGATTSGATAAADIANLASSSAAAAIANANDLSDEDNNAGNEGIDEDDEPHSMEISSISID